MANRKGSPLPARESIRRPLAREVDEILSERGPEREARLLASTNLAAVVALMPPEELFFTLKELGDENVPLVLGQARPEQVQFLFDLEFWRKDRLRRDRVNAWLGRLVECGDEALTRWLRHIDLETWTLLLGSVAKVHLADEESDPFQDTSGAPPFTLDGVHYISAPAELEPVVREIFGVLRREDAGRYFRVIEALALETDSEFEEACFQEKQRRLAERGFAEWEEAYEVYARLPVDRPDSLPPRPAAEAGNPDAEPAVAPRYPLTVAGQAPDLLARALAQVGESGARDTIRSEFAHLANKVVAADALDTAELESYRRAARKAAGYVSIALEHLCGPDEVQAAQVLRERWVQHLFRVGWTQIRAVQSKARRFFDKGWPAGKMERLLFLDSPLPEVLDGLLRRHPLWYAGEEEPPPYREFLTYGEVQRAAKLVERADFLGKFLLSVIDFRLRDLQEAGTRLDLENLKGRTVFLTALVNSALGKDFRFAPLARGEAREGLQRLWVADQPPRRVRPELIDSAVEWSKTAGSLSRAHEAHLREFVGEAMAMVEEEFGHLAADEAPDPRFTRGLWIE